MVKISPTCVVSLMHNVLFFTTMWAANAVQNGARRFCEVRITISCNSRLVSVDFSCLNLVSFINFFGITNYFKWINDHDEAILRLLCTLILLLNVNITVAQQITSEQFTSEQWLSKFDITEYQNKVVYLDFWASWCLPCQQSFPWLNAMQAKYRDKGLVIIAVTLDRDVKKAQQFIKRFPASFLLFSDPKGLLAQKYKITAMPSSYLFSAEGALVDKHLGFKQDDVSNYEASIVKLLDQRANNNWTRYRAGRHFFAWLYR